MQVNTYLQTNRYCRGMVTKRMRPGSPKGQPKPLKRALDSGFPRRLVDAMNTRPGGAVDVPELARQIECSRAVLLKYRKGEGKTVEAHLLVELSDALKVEARWLLTGVGPRLRSEFVPPEVVALAKEILKLPADSQLRKALLATAADNNRIPDDFRNPEGEGE